MLCLLGWEWKLNWLVAKSRVWNCWQVTAYTDINRFALFQCSRDRRIDEFVCIFQIIHHSLIKSKAIVTDKCHKPIINIDESKTIYCTNYFKLHNQKSLKLHDLRYKIREAKTIKVIITGKDGNFRETTARTRVLCRSSSKFCFLRLQIIFLATVSVI